MTLAGLSQTDPARQLRVVVGLCQRRLLAASNTPDRIFHRRAQAAGRIHRLADDRRRNHDGRRWYSTRPVSSHSASGGYVAKAAVTEGDPLAKALMILIREGNLNAAGSDKHSVNCWTALHLQIRIWIWLSSSTTDTFGPVIPLPKDAICWPPLSRTSRTRKPLDKLAAITGAHPYQSSPAVQVNFGHGNRIAGRDFIEKAAPRRTKNKSNVGPPHVATSRLHSPRRPDQLWGISPYLRAGLH